MSYQYRATIMTQAEKIARALCEAYIDGMRSIETFYNPSPTSSYVEDNWHSWLEQAEKLLATE
jgi:hypothetical protein